MAKKNLKKYLKKYWLVLIFILVILLRLPSLFEPFTYGDEGIYLALGQAARKGLVFYRDIHDNKPPMLYLIAALAGNFYIYRLIAFFWGFLTIFVFYRLSVALFKKNKLATIASTLVFAILTSVHTFEGNIANAENFMLLPTITAFLLIYRSKKRSLATWFLAGFLLSLATLFKVPAAFDFAALFVFSFLIFFEQKNKARTKFQEVFMRYTLLLSGFLLPILLTVVYYASQGSLSQYLTAAFFQNIPYLSSWSGQQPQTGNLPLPLLGRALGVFGLVIFLFILKKKVSLVTKLILIWFAFSWFAALLSSRPYPHYLIQALPAFSLSFGLFFNKEKQYLKEKIIPTALLVTLIITLATFHFWHYENLSYYRNFYQYALRKKNQQEYFSDFDNRANTIYQVTNYLKTRTLSNEKIFIWGDAPFVYALAQLLPIGRYTVAYHIVDFNGYEETMTRLQEVMPRYLIVDQEERRSFPEFFIWLEENYALENQLNNFKIYHRFL